LNIKGSAANQTKQLEVIFQSAPMGVALLNDQLVFTTGNPALRRKLGYSSQDLRQKTILEICHPEDRGKLESLVQSAREQTASYLRRELRLTQKSGHYLWVEVSIQHIPSEFKDTGEFVLMIQNIHERKQLQLELLETRRQLIKSNEEERQKLAQELHDGPMQELHSITYQIAGIKDQLPEGVEARLNSIQRTAQNTVKALRALAYNLRPPALSKYGLVKSIQSHAGKFVAQHPELSLNLDLQEDQPPLAEDVELALFRIYQQALTNIILHAEADQAEVSLHITSAAASLQIKDNGRGFQVPNRWIEFVRDGHYGLAGTSERVHALGGEFLISSTPGEGTILTIRIPDYQET
jgi:PAS domain S-box-containing protein